VTIVALIASRDLERLALGTCLPTYLIPSPPHTYAHIQMTPLLREKNL